MLSIQLFRDQPDLIKDRLKVRYFKPLSLVDDIAELDARRRKMQAGLDQKQSGLKQISRDIGKLFQEGKQKEANDARSKTAGLKKDIKKGQNDLSRLDSELRELLTRIPNLPHESVQAGKTEQDNTLIRSWEETIPEGKDRAHWDLINTYDIIDFDLGTKITGAGFPVYKGQGAKLLRAMVNFFLDENIAAGYQEVYPPLVVNAESAFATGQLPDKEGQMYQLPEDDFYLIPTAEVPVTNMYRDMILDAEKLPVKNTAYTACFRREAGSWGADVRGLNRLHQFDKVEIVQIVHPEHSYTVLEEMLIHVEKILRELELPYRIMRLCGGDMGFTSALTYDFEVYAAAQDKWLEVSSVSNFESYQANRLKLRFRDPVTKKPVPVHTLNGSALALPRIMATMIENNQTPEGILIPEALRSYTGFDLITK